MAFGNRSRVLPKFDRGLKLAIATIAVLVCSAGTASAAQLDTTSYDFGNQDVGTTSTAKTFTIAVDGGRIICLPFGGCLPIPEFFAPVVSVSGPFTQTNNCVGTLATPATCTIDVAFVPTAGGPQTGTLSTGTTSDLLPGPAADLQGTGVMPSPPPSSTGDTSSTSGGSSTQPVTIDQPTRPKKRCRKAGRGASASKLRKCNKHHGGRH